MAARLHPEFLVNGWTWSGKVPSEDELRDGIEWLRDHTPEGSSQIVGRLVAVHSPDHFDIYLYQGEIT
jgi:hypothetical protein